MSMNESEEQLKALRPQVEEAVQELIRQRGLSRTFTGVLEYHGFKIRVQRPVSYTWEQNNNIKDATLDYYKSLHAMTEQLNNDLKKRRAEMKGTVVLPLRVPARSFCLRGSNAVFQALATASIQTADQADLRRLPAIVLKAPDKRLCLLELINPGCYTIEIII